MTRHLLLLALATAALTDAAAQAPVRNPGSQNRPAGRDPAGAVAHRDLAYVDGGHERQKLDLFVPATGDGPFPVILWVHGGGWQNGSKDGCPPLRQGYLERGYAVASLGYRLSQHAVFPAQIEDCKAAIRWLRAHAAQYKLDPKRFGAWGSSAGGHLVALLGTGGDVKEFDVGPSPDRSSRVQAVCDYYGPTDFDAFVAARGYESHATDSSPEARLIGGAVEDNPDKARRASPVTYVTPDDPPFLIVHGDKDPVVPYNQSQILFEALKKADVGVHLHTIRGAGHGQGFGGPEIGQMVSGFFDRTLKANTLSNKGEAKTSESNASAPEPSPGRTTAATAAPAAVKADIDGFKLDGERWTCGTGDRAVSGILLKPDGKGPFPAVLISHGLGGRADSFGLQKAREFAKWGLVCIAPDYTHNAAATGTAGGGRGRGDAASRTDFGASDENIRRARLCVDLLRAMPEVDGKRIAAYGHSMGGFVTIGLAASDTNLLAAAAVTGSGVAPREGYPAPSGEQSGRIRTPFLMLHGAEDPVVRPGQSERLKAILDRNGVPNERTVYPGEAHNIDRTKQAEVFAAIRAWFGKHRVLPSH